MPLLTKEQITETLFEISAEEREEIVERVLECDRTLQASGEQKDAVLAAHGCDPSGGVS